MLEKERNQIDAIDRQIVALFEERTRVVEAVAAYKLANGIEILDAKREEAVIQKVQGYLQDPSLASELEDLYTHLMRISRQHQAAWQADQSK